MQRIFSFPGMVRDYLNPLANTLYENVPSWKRIQDYAPTLFAYASDAVCIASVYQCCKQLPNWFLAAGFIGTIADTHIPSAIERIINIWKAFPIQTSLAAYYYLPVSFKAGTVLFGAHIGARISKHVQSLSLESPNSSVHNPQNNEIITDRPSPSRGFIADYLNIRGVVVHYLTNVRIIHSLYERIPTWQNIKRQAPDFVSLATKCSYGVGAYLCSKEWPYLFWSSCIVGGMTDKQAASQTAKKIKGIWNAYCFEILLGAIQFSHLPSLNLTPVTCIPIRGYRIHLLLPNIQFSTRTAIVATILLGMRIGSKISKSVQEQIELKLKNKEIKVLDERC